MTALMTGIALLANLASEPNLATLKGTWLNVPSKFALEKNKVTVVHFFTYGCSNCKANLPYYDKWLTKFGNKIQLVGVHSPETKTESDIENVKNALQKHHIKYPVLIDNSLKVFRSWNLRYWPSVFVLDKSGAVRQVWEGELQFQGQDGYRKLSKSIHALIEETR